MPWPPTSRPTCCRLWTTSTPRTIGRSRPSYSESRRALGVRLALFRSAQQSLQLRSHHRHHAHPHPGVRPRINFIAPYNGGGVYGNTLVNPSLGDFAPRVGFAYAVDPDSIASAADSAPAMPLHPRRIGRHPRHQRAQRPLRLRHPASAATAAGYRTLDQGYPAGLAAGSTSAPAPTTSHTSPRTPKTATSRASSSTCRSPSPRTHCSTSPISAITASRLQGFLNANQGNPVCRTTRIPQHRLH